MPSIKAPHEVQMEKLKTIVEEHFDDYLLVLLKDNQEWHTYKNKTSAYGMASLILHGISCDWTNQHNNAKE